VGHEALLAAAFRAGPRVAIGLTTEAFLADHPKPWRDRLQSYDRRRRALRSWLARRYPVARWTVVPLSDRFGRSVEDGVDALVVSADTVDGGRAVNEERRRRGRRSVPLLVVPLVLADDLRPVSSRRVRSGEIDRFGRRLREISVGVVLVDPHDHVPVERALRDAFPRPRITFVRPPRPTRGTGAATGWKDLARRAVRGRELGLLVVAGGARARKVVLASPEVALDPVTVPAGTATELGRAVRDLVARSSAAKRLRREPR
jgi:pantetheine-phosphate adenylyltransferase